MGAAGATGTMLQVQQSNSLQSRIDSLEATNSDLSISRIPKIESDLDQGIKHHNIFNSFPEIKKQILHLYRL